MKKRITEDTLLEFSNYNQLSYMDEGKAFVDLYVDDKVIGRIRVYKDSEMEDREYVCINHEVVYLDSINKKH